MNKQFQGDLLDFMIEVLLPCSSLRPLLDDVSTACTVALIQVIMYLQGQTPAKAQPYNTNNQKHVRN